MSGETTMPKTTETDAARLAEEQRLRDPELKILTSQTNISTAFDRVATALEVARRGRK